MTIDQTAREIATEICDKIYNETAHKCYEWTLCNRCDLDEVQPHIEEILRRHESLLRAECERLVREWGSRRDNHDCLTDMSLGKSLQLRDCATALAAVLAKEVSE